MYGRGSLKRVEGWGEMGINCWTQSLYLHSLNWSTPFQTCICLIKYFTMEFVFEKFNESSTGTHSVIEYFVIRPKVKSDRRNISKCLKRVQYQCAHVKVKLTTFPKIDNNSIFNFYNPENTLREDVVETIRRLSFNRILVVAEVYSSY